MRTDYEALPKGKTLITEGMMKGVGFKQECEHHTFGQSENGFTLNNCRYYCGESKAITENELVITAPSGSEYSACLNVLYYPNTRTMRGFITSDTTELAIDTDEYKWNVNRIDDMQNFTFDVLYTAILKLEGMRTPPTENKHND